MKVMHSPALPVGRLPSALLWLPTACHLCCSLWQMRSAAALAAAQCQTRMAGQRLQLPAAGSGPQDQGARVGMGVGRWTDGRWS